MQLHYWWWILTLLLCIAELLTGTIYLMVLALGTAAGGLIAWFGGSLTWQVTATALVSLAGWLLLWRRNPWRTGKPPGTDRNMLLDIGERLEIDEWSDGRRTRVRHRGAQWTVELDHAEPDSAARPGVFVVGRIVGARLIVRPADDSLA